MLEKFVTDFVIASLFCSILLEGESSAFRNSEVVGVLDFFVLKNFRKFTMRTLQLLDEIFIVVVVGF